MANSSRYISTNLIQAVKLRDHHGIVRLLKEEKESLNEMDSQGKTALVWALSIYKEAKFSVPLPSLHRIAGSILHLLEANAEQKHLQIESDLDALAKCEIPAQSDLIYTLWTAYYRRSSNIQVKKNAYRMIYTNYEELEIGGLKLKWLLRAGLYDDAEEVYRFSLKLLSEDKWSRIAVSMLERSFFLYGGVGASQEEVITTARKLAFEKHPELNLFTLYMALCRMYIVRLNGQNTQYDPIQSLAFFKRAQVIFKKNQTALEQEALICFYRVLACLNENAALTHYETAAKLGDIECAFLGAELANSKNQLPETKRFLEYAVTNTLRLRSEDALCETLNSIHYFKGKWDASYHNTIDEVLLLARAPLAESKESNDAPLDETPDLIALRFNGIGDLLSYTIQSRNLPKENKESKSDPSDLGVLVLKWQKALLNKDGYLGQNLGEEIVDKVLGLAEKTGNVHIISILKKYGQPYPLHSQYQQVILILLYHRMVKLQHVKSYLEISSKISLHVILKFLAGSFALSLELLNNYSSVLIDNTYILYPLLVRKDSEAYQIIEGQVKVIASKIPRLSDAIKNKAKKLVAYVKDTELLFHDAHVLNYLPALQYLEQHLANNKHIISRQENICSRIYICTKICFLLLSQSEESLRAQYGYVADRIFYFLKRNRDFLHQCAGADKALFVRRFVDDKMECVQFAKWAIKILDGVKKDLDSQLLDPDIYLFKVCPKDELIRRRLLLGRKNSGMEWGWFEAKMKALKGKFVTTSASVIFVLSKTKSSAKIKDLELKDVPDAPIKKGVEPVKSDEILGVRPIENYFVLR